MKILTLIPLLLCSGCLMVPTSKIRIGAATLAIPKNIEVRGLTVTITGTNIQVAAELIKSVNDPAVIDKSAAGQVAIIRELGAQVEKAALMAK